MPLLYPTHTGCDKTVWNFILIHQWGNCTATHCGCSHQWGSGSQVWPGHCNSYHVCKLGCFFTSSTKDTPLCCSVGRVCRQSPACCSLQHQQNGPRDFVHLKTASAAPCNYLSAPPLHFAEEPICGELSEPWKTSCLPTVLILLCATNCTCWPQR